jgi:hypothetical protein
MSWVKGLEQEEPDVAMTADDAADLGRCRRGVEPLRIVASVRSADRRTSGLADADSCVIAMDGAGLHDGLTTVTGYPG